MKNDEMNKLIAINIMGWEAKEIHSRIPFTLFIRPNLPRLPDGAWNPTTNIQTALEVVKALRLKHIYFEIDTATCSVKAFTIEEDKNPPYHHRKNLISEQCESIEMEDLPLRICRVALQSVGFNVDLY